MTVIDTSYLQQILFEYATDKIWSITHDNPEMWISNPGTQENTQRCQLPVEIWVVVYNLHIYRG